MLAPDDRRSVVELDRQREALEEPLRRPPRHEPRPLDVLEQHRELVAAEAARGVAGPDDRPDALGDDPERPIALGVAEPVVQVLEVVEVDEQHRGVVRAAAAQPVEGVVHAVLEPRAVREPRQRVAVGQLAELVVQARVVERDRRLADEQLRELDVALGERIRAGGAQLDDADRLAAHDQRQHHQRSDRRCERRYATSAASASGSSTSTRYGSCVCQDRGASPGSGRGRRRAGGRRHARSGGCRT